MNDSTPQDHIHKPQVNQIFVTLGCIMMAIALAMVSVWASKSETEEGYLGGLNWNDKVVIRKHSFLVASNKYSLE